MNNSLILILCGLIGVFFHCLIKLNTFLNRARSANIDFRPWKDYWVTDAVPILLSLCSVSIWYLIFGEFVIKFPAIAAFVRTSFVVMGAIGSYLIQMALSTTAKRMQNIIDNKTNAIDPPGTKTPLIDGKTS